MELLIVTGMSGAGKSFAAKALEDIGFYCVDNIPPLIIPTFADVFADSSEFKKLAIITDIRGGELFKDILSVLEKLKNETVSFKILFLTAKEDVLVRRYKENRRVHPLCADGKLTIGEAVNKEREVLKDISNISDFVIDTSSLSVSQLKEQLTSLFKGRQKSITVQCMAFGFKYGVPTDADLVFDVRPLPNPFYVPELKKLTGKNKEVQDYVMNSADSTELFDKIHSLIEYLLPLYLKEGKSQLTIAFGCTGGKHRSVTFAELMNAKLLENGTNSIVVNRDIFKN